MFEIVTVTWASSVAPEEDVYGIVNVASPAVAVVLGVMVYSQGLFVASARVTEVSLVWRFLAVPHVIV